jgi:hypothetical protein
LSLLGKNGVKSKSDRNRLEYKDAAPKDASTEKSRSSELETVMAYVSLLLWLSAAVHDSRQPLLTFPRCLFQSRSQLRKSSFDLLQ